MHSIVVLPIDASIFIINLEHEHEDYFSKYISQFRNNNEKICLYLQHIQ